MSEEAADQTEAMSGERPVARIRAMELIVVAMVLGGVGCRRRGVEIAADNGDAQRSVCVAPPEVLHAPHEIREGCAFAVAGLVVGEGGRLVMRPGSRLTFTKGSALRVEGGVLDLQGSKDAPVVLTADASSDWAGVAFPSTVRPVNAMAFLSTDPSGPHPSTPLPLPAKRRSNLTHVVIDRATGAFGDLPGMQVIRGFEVVPAPHAAISIIDETQRVTLVDVTVGDERRTAVYVAGYGVALEKLENSALRSGSEPAMIAGAMAIGRVRSRRFGSPIHTYGRVFESQTWTDLGGPVVLDANVDVEALSGTEAVTLRLGEGLVIVGGSFAGFEIAREHRGVRFEATGVRFLRAEKEKFPWRPLSLPGRAYAPLDVAVRSCTFDHPRTLDIDTLDWDKSATIAIDHTTFEHPEGTAIHVYRDCARFTASALANHAIGGPLCSTYMGSFE